MKPSLCRFEDLVLGQQASFTKTITDADISHFVAITGDVNPLHVDATFTAQTFFKRPIAHGMLVGALFSHVLGMLMPGTGAIYRSQTLTFLKPVYVGDTIQASLKITRIDPREELIEMEGRIRNQFDDMVTEGISTATLLRAFTQ